MSCWEYDLKVTPGPIATNRKVDTETHQYKLPRQSFFHIRKPFEFHDLRTELYQVLTSRPSVQWDTVCYVHVETDRNPAYQIICSTEIAIHNAGRPYLSLWHAGRQQSILSIIHWICCHMYLHMEARNSTVVAKLNVLSIHQKSRSEQPCVHVNILRLICAAKHHSFNQACPVLLKPQKQHST